MSWRKLGEWVVCWAIVAVFAVGGVACTEAYAPVLTEIVSPYVKAVTTSAGLLGSDPRWVSGPEGGP